ncbi:hypothetical protein GCM10010156_76450 [Planobispora rosea]|uniref:Uncharacterized protein n=1 Tax=Planobispora rosea TaxID=35762 RepID=A0A8J3WGG7_PLARO|nr:hypothetical protein [Planobispora rosea]GGT08082.1 hypothetical protein GCM10010156_76450 [Planobispora rosea]GIH89314.1 hypothetical protein Pro02_77220 [Planobispora rosea]
MDETFDSVIAGFGRFLLVLWKVLVWIWDGILAAETAAPVLFWTVLLLGSIVWAVVGLIRHMGARKVMAGGAMLGVLSHTDATGATLWRSAESVDRKASYSPFYGRPAILRLLPAPTIITTIFMLAHARLLLGYLLLAIAALMGWRLYRKVQRHQHIVKIVYPIAAALGTLYGQKPGEVMRAGLRVPYAWRDPAAQIVIALPPHWRPPHIDETVQIVTERLGGTWDYELSPEGPYTLTLTHRPAEPLYVTQVIRPLAAALATTHGTHSRAILEGMVITDDWEDPAADPEVSIPLPDDYREYHVLESKKIVGERLGGEWTYEVVPGPPYTVQLRRRPPDPEYIVEVVRPMTEALSPVLGMPAEEILEGVIVPEDWQDPAAAVQVPLPDGYRPVQATEVVRVVEERLGGDWAGTATKAKPFVVHLRHKPQPPDLVTLQDVADEILRYARRGTFFLGIGAGHEHRVFTPHRDAPHIALSAGTQAGKSTQNRNFLLGAAAMGAQQVCVDPKIHSYDGCEIIPGVTIYNDPLRPDLMWSAIHGVAEETRRRMVLPRGAEEFRPFYLHLEEQNQFAGEIENWWTEIREFPDELEEICLVNPVINKIMSRYRWDKLPKKWPGWRDIQLLLYQGGGFDVHLVSTYQRMDADAVGGSGGKGGSLRAQYGIKLMSHFDPAGWINVVGTRPIPRSPMHKGRWIMVKGSTNKEYQGPRTEVDDIEWFLDYAGIGRRELSPSVSPSRPRLPSSHPYPIRGDKETADRGQTPPAASSAPGAEVLPFRRREEDRPSNGPAPSGNVSQAITDPPSKVHYYTLEEAANEGIVPLTYANLKQRRYRAEQDGKPFPKGIKYGRGRKYTADELRQWWEQESGASKTVD